MLIVHDLTHITLRIVPMGTATETCTESFSLTEQELVAPSHFHKCPIYLLGQLLFPPEIPFRLGSQLKGVCVCGEGHNSCAGLLRGKAGLARLELCSRALKDMRLASSFFSFFSSL